MTNYRMTTLEELQKVLDLNEALMFDSETIGLYGRIRIVQFYQPHFKDENGEPYAMIVEYPNVFELAKLLQNAKVVIHNAHYDITTIQEQLGRLTWIPKDFHCTFLLSRLQFHTKDGFSLDNVISYVLGSSPYGHTKKDMQKSNWAAPVLSDEQLTYAALDVICLNSVWEAVQESIDTFSYKLDLISLKDCLDFQNNGMPLDLARVRDRYSKNMAAIKEINLPINVNSWQQVRPYIGSGSSDDEALSLLTIQGNTRAENVNKVRKLIKNNSFLSKYLDSAGHHEYHEDFGILYGKFKPSARSGRLTSDDNNLQQIPRSLKGIFGVPENGNEIILFSDFAQIQLRAVCAITKDVAMEKLFREGADLHDYVTKIIFSDNFTKTQRQICKTANFSLLFGAGIAVFKKVLIMQAKLLLSDDEAYKIKKLWLKLWAQIAAWQETGIKDWKKGKAWQTPLGRKYTAKMMTDQLAMQIQGYEAEVAKLAAHYMKPRMANLSPLIKKRNFIHDSYIFTCPNDPEIYIQAMNIIAECMQEAWTEMSSSVAIPDLPMPVKVRAGWNWGDIEKDIFVHEISIK